MEPTRCNDRCDRHYNDLVHIITTHLTADFDAFSSAVCAVRLFPDHKVVFPGSLEGAVRRFREETGVPIAEVKLREARRCTLEHAVVLDTANPARLGEVWQLIQRDACPVLLIDHHRSHRQDLVADTSHLKRVGATCTILVELFQKRGIQPTKEEASLLLMGIYEDTGSLSYRDTTVEDLQAAAWLLQHGARLSWVRRWVSKGLEPAQLELLNRLVEGSEERRLGDTPVAVSTVDVDRYHEEAAYVVHRWVETFQLPVGVALLVNPPHIQMILRSRVAGLDVGAVARRFGGGGHTTASSARVCNRMVVEVREELWRELERTTPPAATAGEAAGRKIFTVETTTTVEAAKQRLNQLRVNALPVSDSAAGGELVGVVTRLLLDNAVSLGLRHRPVSTVMQPGVPVADADTPLDDLRAQFLEGSHRFVVVTRDGQPVGLLTRLELFRRLFARLPEAGTALDNRMASQRPVQQNVRRLLREVAPAWVNKLLENVQDAADEHGVRTYLVGGAVRDLLLDRPNEDVDIVVEGDGIRLAETIASRTGGRCHPYEPFMTAVVTLPDGHSIDVASARTEFYRTPAALPEVATSLIRQDLYRRDFTINALAIALEGERFGQLIDFFGGRRDLERREIRVLHSLSFIDDPTRAIRAVRYARRLHFNVAQETRHLIGTAITEGVFDRLSGQRLRRELEQLLTVPHPTPTLGLLAELGLLQAICPPLTWSEQRRSFLLQVEAELSWFVVEQLGEPPSSLVLFLGGLAVLAGDDAPSALVDRLQLTGAAASRIIGLAGRMERLQRESAAEAPMSQRVAAVESCGADALLLTMAGLELDDRRRLAEAADAANRAPCPITGADLRAAGIPEGPHVGEALRATRAALLDGHTNADEALAYATRIALEAT